MAAALIARRVDGLEHGVRVHAAARCAALEGVELDLAHVLHLLVREEHRARQRGRHLDGLARELRPDLALVGLDPDLPAADLRARRDANLRAPRVLLCRPLPSNLPLTSFALPKFPPRSPRRPALLTQLSPS
eukprot:7249178-Pyramimonas_sp.AAC.1